MRASSHFIMPSFRVDHVVEIALTHRFQINLRGIIDLLSNHLYSRPEVFVRELLQNAVDAITARQQLAPEHAGEITLTATAPRGNPPTLEVTDNGIGSDRRRNSSISGHRRRDVEARRRGPPHRRLHGSVRNRLALVLRGER